jgi:hypothetical protein
MAGTPLRKRRTAHRAGVRVKELSLVCEGLPWYPIVQMNAPVIPLFISLFECKSV